MGCEDEVFKISKKLDKIIANGVQIQLQALDLLKALKELPITLDVLHKTRIGMTVNSLRKSTDDEDIISLSKSLIKSWKKLLPEAPTNKGDGNGTSSQAKEKSENCTLTSSASSAPKNGSNKESFKEPNQKIQAKVPAKVQGKSSTKNTNKAKSTSAKSTHATEKAVAPKQTSFPSELGCSIRVKCRELLANALKTQGEPEEGFCNTEELADRIECCIFDEFKDTGMKYKNRVRSRVSNLKDPKNPNLRLNVLNGHISPEKIAVMTADEMATDEMKMLRQKFTKEAINDHQMAVTSGTKTNLLKCGRCRKSNCTYNQVQTRSADEPMTTFVFCNECGHRWKFC